MLALTTTTLRASQGATVLRDHHLQQLIGEDAISSSVMALMVWRRLESGCGWSGDENMKSLLESP